MTDRVGLEACSGVPDSVPSLSASQELAARRKSLELGFTELRAASEGAAVTGLLALPQARSRLSGHIIY